MANLSRTIQVEGMSCSHCENAVKKAVGSLEGVGNVSVDLAAKKVSVEYDPGIVAWEKIRQAIEDQGYDPE